MSTPRSHGQYPKGVNRREQIIQTAADVFATEGFEGTALKRVAELVGVREASLFYYFSGKQELLTAVLAERDRRGLVQDNTDTATLDLLVPSAERNCQEPGLTTLYAVASATANDPAHDSHEYFKNRYSTMVNRLGADIEVRQQEGQFRTDVPALELARMVVAIFDGLQLQWLYDKEIDVASGLSEFIGVLLRRPDIQGTAQGSTKPAQGQ